MTTSVPVADFLAHFHDYKFRLGRGESFAVCEDGKTVAEVKPPAFPVAEVRQRPPLGALRHLIGDVSNINAADREIEKLMLGETE